MHQLIGGKPDVGLHIFRCVARGLGKVAFYFAHNPSSEEKDRFHPLSGVDVNPAILTHGMDEEVHSAIRKFHGNLATIRKVPPTRRERNSLPSIQHQLVDFLQIGPEVLIRNKTRITLHGFPTTPIGMEPTWLGEQVKPDDAGVDTPSVRAVIRHSEEPRPFLQNLICQRISLPSVETSYYRKNVKSRPSFLLFGSTLSSFSF